jgi:hypothetical protein
MLIPFGGRPLVTANSIFAARSRATAAIARGVNTFASVTSVPSTSAMTRRIEGGVAAD